MYICEETNDLIALEKNKRIFLYDCVFQTTHSSAVKRTSREIEYRVSHAANPAKAVSKSIRREQTCVRAEKRDKI